MEFTFGERLRNAWNAFQNRKQYPSENNYGYGSYIRPDRTRLTRGNDRSIMTSVLNRIALDVASIEFKHCKMDENGRYNKEVNSTLNSCLNLEANIDQTSKALIQDIVLTMFDKGCVAVVPIDTSENPFTTNSYDILTMRAGSITQWYPSSVRVLIYNDRTGKKEEIVMPKRKIGIIENPLYSVMNEHNSTLSRLTRKLALLDTVDEQNSSGKLDLIIQLPYVIKSEARKQQANDRRIEIERQLAGSKYGIAYTDGTEKITQLNRPVENNLMKQVEYLTSMLYGQLGITQDIMDGTADEKTMLNYYSRTIEPIVTAIALEIERKFLTKTARSQGQTIKFFRDPFKLVPVKELAELADKFTRNEILSSNEIRSIVGYKPSEDPRADMLINSNLNHNENYGIQNGASMSNPLPAGEDSELEDNTSDEEYMQEILSTLTPEQKQAVDFIINSVLEDEQRQKGGNS